MTVHVKATLHWSRLSSYIRMFACKPQSALPTKQRARGKHRSIRLELAAVSLPGSRHASVAYRSSLQLATICDLSRSAHASVRLELAAVSNLNGLLWPVHAACGEGLNPANNRHTDNQHRQPARERFRCCWPPLLVCEEQACRQHTGNRVAPSSATPWLRRERRSSELRHVSVCVCVCVCTYFFTTSMPSVTSPNTCNT